MNVFWIVCVPMNAVFGEDVRTDLAFVKVDSKPKTVLNVCDCVTLGSPSMILNNFFVVCPSSREHTVANFPVSHFPKYRLVQMIGEFLNT